MSGAPTTTGPVQGRGDDSEIGVAILGAGFGGLCMAIKLLEAGRRDVVIFEKAADLGGTWRDNTYPGCACDIPSHLYSFSFEQSPDWSRTYAAQPEILAYLRRVAVKRGVDRLIRYETPIARLEWDDDRRLWRLTAADGRQFVARAVVSAVGGLHIPKMPDIPGLESFAGPVFHTARWRHDVDLAGRNIAVIGTGTSAAQVIPALAERAETLAVFQRSPPWVLPRRDRTRSPLARRLQSALPWLGRLGRALRYLRAETAGLAFTGAPRLVGGG
ncbi:MAG: flavin-containing monooxygenase, partial [Planctomycetaceae bacterium]